MSIFYLNYGVGDDSKDGTSWDNAWRTFSSGPTAARIAPGDVIRIAKSPDPTLVGNAKWIGDITTSTTFLIKSSTNASPIVITTEKQHGLSNGDVVLVWGHTTNNNANGYWVVANVTSYTFELVGSTGNGVGGFVGYIRRCTNECVKLDNAVTALVDECNQGWNAVAITNITYANDTTNYKTVSSAKFTGASAFAIGKFGYKGFTSKDLSNYTQISFYFRTSIALTAGQLQIKLCSDATGNIPVNTFDFPAIPSLNVWIPITINAGAALGNNITSVSLYTTADLAAFVFNIDNIIVCKDPSLSDSLSLQSQISKASNAQNTTETWHCLAGIVDNILILDNDCSDKVYKGYYGVSETVSTYKRETIKTPMTSASANVICPINDSGVANNYIEFQGGYNTSTNTQDGESIFDGLSTLGRGFYIDKNYIKMICIGVCRYYTGFRIEGTENYLDNIYSINNNYYGITAYSPVSNMTLNNLVNVNNNVCGIYLYQNTGTVTINNIVNFSNNTSYATTIRNASNCTIQNITNINNNGNYGLYIYLSDYIYIDTIGNISYNYDDNIRLETVNFVTFNSIDNCNYSSSDGLALYDVKNCKFSSINNLSNNTGYGLLLANGSSSCVFDFIDIISGNGYSGLYISDSIYNNFKLINTISNNGTYAIYFTGVSATENTINGFTSSGNVSGSIYCGGQRKRNYMRNVSLTEDSKFTYDSSVVSSTKSDSQLFMYNYGKQSNNHVIYYDHGSTTTDANITRLGSGISWKITSDAQRDATYPIEFKVAEVLVEANKTVTSGIWVLKSSSDTTFEVRLICKGKQLTGIDNDVYDDATDSTEWQQLACEVLPTETGVLEYYVQVWGGGTSYVHVDDFSVAQLG